MSSRWTESKTTDDTNVLHRQERQKKKKTFWLKKKFLVSKMYLTLQENDPILLNMQLVRKNKEDKKLLIV